MGELSQESARLQIVFSQILGRSLAGRLVVKWANSVPGGQAIGAAKDVHAGANCEHQHGPRR